MGFTDPFSTSCISYRSTSQQSLGSVPDPALFTTLRKTCVQPHSAKASLALFDLDSYSEPIQEFLGNTCHPVDSLCL